MTEDSNQRTSTLEDVPEVIIALMRAGRSIGDAAFVGELGELIWVVSGRNGENLIRAEGATKDEAWRVAKPRDDCSPSHGPSGRSRRTPSRVCDPSPPGRTGGTSNGPGGFPFNGKWATRIRWIRRHGFGVRRTIIKAVE